MDDDIHMPKLILRLIKKRLHRRRITDISLNGECLTAGRLDQSNDFICLAGAACKVHDDSETIFG